MSLNCRELGLEEMSSIETLFDDVDNIQFTSTNYLTNESITIEFESDRTIEQMVKKFRAFLMAETFAESLIGEWIADPCEL